MKFVSASTVAGPVFKTEVFGKGKALFTSEAELFEKFGSVTPDGG